MQLHPEFAYKRLAIHIGFEDLHPHGVQIEEPSLLRC